jgi:hypothetical protein
MQTPARSLRGSAGARDSPSALAPDARGGTDAPPPPAANSHAISPAIPAPTGSAAAVALMTARAFAAARAGARGALPSMMVHAPDAARATDADGTTLLHWAALRGDEAAIDACLIGGADVSPSSRCGGAN